jgi:hypothetical protein
VNPSQNLADIPRQIESHTGLQTWCGILVKILRDLNTAKKDTSLALKLFDHPDMQRHINRYVHFLDSLQPITAWVAL